MSEAKLEQIKCESCGKRIMDLSVDRIKLALSRLEDYNEGEEIIIKMICPHKKRAPERGNCKHMNIIKM